MGCWFPSNEVEWFIPILSFAKTELNAVIVLVEWTTEPKVIRGEGANWVDSVFPRNIESSLSCKIGVDCIKVLPVVGWETVVTERDAINDNLSLDIVAVPWNTGVVDTSTVWVGLNEGVSWRTGLIDVRLTLRVGVYEEDSNANDMLSVWDGLYELVDMVWISLLRALGVLCGEVDIVEDLASFW